MHEVGTGKHNPNSMSALQNIPVRSYNQKMANKPNTDRVIAMSRW